MMGDLLPTAPSFVVWPLGVQGWRSLGSRDQEGGRSSGARHQIQQIEPSIVDPLHRLGQYRQLVSLALGSMALTDLKRVGHCEPGSENVFAKLANVVLWSSVNRGAQGGQGLSTRRGLLHPPERMSAQ